MQRCDCAVTTIIHPPVPQPVLNETDVMVMGIGGCMPRPIYLGGGQSCCCQCGSSTDKWKMVIDTGGYSDIAFGETMPITCKVMFGDTDRTEDVIKWKVSRNSGDTAADAIWDAAHTNFAGTIDIHYTQDIDDLHRKDGRATVFTFTAIVGNVTFTGNVNCGKKNE